MVASAGFSAAYSSKEAVFSGCGSIGTLQLAKHGNCFDCLLAAIQSMPRA